MKAKSKVQTDAAVCSLCFFAYFFKREHKTIIEWDGWVTRASRQTFVDQKHLGRMDRQINGHKVTFKSEVKARHLCKVDASCQVSVSLWARYKRRIIAKICRKWRENGKRSFEGVQGPYCEWAGAIMLRKKNNLSWSDSRHQIFRVNDLQTDGPIYLPTEYGHTLL